MELLAEFPAQGLARLEMWVTGCSVFRMASHMLLLPVGKEAS